MRGGVILRGDASILAGFKPEGVVSWEIIHFTGKRPSPAQRVEISRRLRGRGEQPGLVKHAGPVLGPGGLLLAPTRAQPVKDAFDELGASCNVVLVGRST
jgi:hypothetical protein